MGSGYAELIMKISKSQPIIIVGCHRSGTTILSQLLEEAGVFQGKKKDANNESFFFMDINQWMMRRAGGNWDWTEPTAAMLEHPESRDAVTNHVRRYLCERLEAKFFGLKKIAYLRNNDPKPKSWGWKDPRTTITAPVWRSIFPNAKYIYVSRHGVDVAASLQTRATRGKTLSRPLTWKIADWPNLKLGRCELPDSIRGASLDGAFRIWAEYSAAASRLMTDVGSNGLTIRYEELLENPLQQLNRVGEFCRAGSLSFDLCQESYQLNQSRALAYRSQPHLVKFANSKSEDLRELGYDP